MREIKFKAYIPDLDIILKDITLYGDGQMGCYEDDFVESLPDKYTYDPDMGGVLLIDDENDIFETILTPLYGEDWIWLEENQFIPMQFTGLYDKNNKPIYEGDILRIPAKDDYEKHTFNSFEVFWHDNDSCDNHIGWQMNRIHCNGNSAGGNIVYRMIPRHTALLEIIGNIHQNKDLLDE